MGLKEETNLRLLGMRETIRLSSGYKMKILRKEKKEEWKKSSSKSVRM
jgi:hypothetical protein